MLFNQTMKYSSIALLLAGTVSCGQIHLTEDPFSASDATRTGKGAKTNPKVTGHGSSDGLNNTDSDSSLNGDGDGQSCQASTPEKFALACDVFVTDVTPTPPKSLNLRHRWLARGFCIDSDDKDDQKVFEGNIGNQVVLSVNTTAAGADTDMRFGLYKQFAGATKTEMAPFFTDGQSKPEIKEFSASSCSKDAEGTVKIEETKNVYSYKIACTIEEGSCDGRFMYNYLAEGETIVEDPAGDDGKAGDEDNNGVLAGDDLGDGKVTPSQIVTCEGKNGKEPIWLTAELDNQPIVRNNGKKGFLSDITITSGDRLPELYTREVKNDRRTGLGASYYQYVANLGPDAVHGPGSRESFVKFKTKNHKTGTAQLSGDINTTLKCNFEKPEAKK